MLNQIQLYLTRQCTILFNKYPSLYKVMDYFFTILAVFNVYLYITVFKLHNKFKDNFPILYSITVYIYIEYLGIVKGDLSKHIGVIISLYVLFDLNKINILLFTLLLLNTWCKQLLIKDKWIRTNYPILHQILLDISSLVNTILIIYFLDSIWLEIVVPFWLNLWNGLLKMYDPVRDCFNNGDSDSDKTPGKILKNQRALLTQNTI